jgi:hypothetical protein
MPVRSCVQLKMIGVLAAEAVFMVAVVVGVLLGAHTHEKRSMIVGILCVIFGTIMYASPLTIMVRTYTLLPHGSYVCMHALLDPRCFKPSIYRLLLRILEALLFCLVSFVLNFVSCVLMHAVLVVWCDNMHCLYDLLRG